MFVRRSDFRCERCDNRTDHRERPHLADDQECQGEGLHYATPPGTGDRTGPFVTGINQPSSAIVGKGSGTIDAALSQGFVVASFCFNAKISKKMAP